MGDSPFMKLDETVNAAEEANKMSLFRKYQAGVVTTAPVDEDAERQEILSKETATVANDLPQHVGNKKVEEVPKLFARSLFNNQKQKAEKGPPVIRQSTNAISVNSRQRGNPVLNFISNVAWEFSEIEPDYILGKTTCCLFLSLRYHNLNSDYIHERIKKLGKLFELRLLLVQVDIKDPHYPLKELAKLCISTDMTLILAWSPEEAGRYLDTYKAFEHKPPDAIREPQKTSNDRLGQITDFLTTVRSVNRTDSASLLTMFGSVSEICHANKEALELCPGLGQQKVKRLYDAIRTNFKTTSQDEKKT